MITASPASEGDSFWPLVAAIGSTEAGRASTVRSGSGAESAPAVRGSTVADSSNPLGDATRRPTPDTELAGSQCGGGENAREPSASLDKPTKMVEDQTTATASRPVAAYSR